MAWTDPDPGSPRSRDELLAAVVRRGRRIRRRRQTAAALFGAVALVVPVVILASLPTGRTADVNLTAAGPFAADLATPPASGSALGGSSDLGAGSGDPVVEPTTTTVLSRPFVSLVSTTTLAVAVQPAPTTTTAPPEGRSGAPTTIPPADHPTDRDGLVRPTPVPGTVGSATAAGGASAPAETTPTTAAAAGAPALANCPAADVAVTVATEHPSYAPGETVRGFSMLENRSGTTCLLPTRSFFHVEDGAGRTVTNFAYTADYPLPVRAEPGRTVTDGFSWDQRNCAGGPCLQVPAGTYVVFANWTEAGSYTGHTSFAIGG